MKRTNIGSELVSALCDYLALRRHFFYRSNNVPVFDRARGAYRALPKYTMKGIPDITVVKDGRYIGIEAKAGSGRLSADQIQFKNDVERAGGTYLLARSIDDLRTKGL